ncbi:TPA: helix-turn-helix transcriptional regulator, partial [Pseudomonas aeruginosa]|nr:helix-turn-helix transcriptional regulator [Pseudomonas aeruginosa]
RLGTLLLQQGRFAEAQHRLREGRDECAACGDPAVLWGYLGLAELAALQGDVDAAFRHLEDAERLMQYQHVDELLYRGLLLRAKVRLWLVQGRVEQADRALISMPEAVLHCSPLGVPDLHLHLQLLRIRVCLAREQFEPALSQLATMHAQAVAEGRRPLACEIGFCLAEGFYAWNRPGQAKQALLDTLVLARQLKLTTSERVFSQRFPALMRSARESSRGETEAVELLSRRERDVLKLIAYGMSNQEIAERLCISLHTVKTHAQRIHFKLGVERRTQALARAKELGLV